MRLLMVVPLFVLAACTGTTDNEAAVSSQQPDPVVIVQEPPVVASAVPLPVEEEIVLPPAAEPERLTGLSPKDVQGLMGEPSLVRRDNSVQVMMFETPNCVFEIIFFEPHEDAHFSATDMYARTRKGTNMDLQTCLTMILPNGYNNDHSDGGR